MLNLYSLLVDHSEAVIHGMLVILGYILALIVTYVKFGQDLSFIKGQLSTILESQSRIAGLVEKSAIVEAKLSMVSEDLNKVFLRVRLLEEMN